VFALDATAKSGVAKGDGPGDWAFSVQGRVGQMHRWDLTERVETHALNVNVKGRWNVGAANLVAEEIAVEGPRIESPRNVPPRWRNPPSMELRWIHWDSGIGLVGLVSRVSSGRGGECHGGTVFYGWDDPARLAAGA